MVHLPGATLISIAGPCTRCTTHPHHHCSCSSVSVTCMLSTIHSCMSCGLSRRPPYPAMLFLPCLSWPLPWPVKSADQFTRHSTFHCLLYHTVTCMSTLCHGASCCLGQTCCLLHLKAAPVSLCHSVHLVCVHCMALTLGIIKVQNCFIALPPPHSLTSSRLTGTSIHSVSLHTTAVQWNYELIMGRCQ